MDHWFRACGWRPFAFQREVWAAAAAGESGLLHATTGSGKTLAAWIGALRRAGSAAPAAAGPRVIWVTPMRALAADTARTLQASAEALGTGWRVALRTGDTPTAERARQDRRPSDALVTTPESLSLMLSRPDARSRLEGVQALVVDEWHELLGSKRGVQVQLALARLRRWNPGLIVWGLSATLGNLAQSLDALLGPGVPGRLVRGQVARALTVDTLIPDTVSRFPWAGHLGIRMVEPVAREIEASGTCLLFTNTRAQAELWYQALLEARPEWAGLLALHHGSLDRSLRDWVEAGLKAGSLKACVCTSSLDLGVDFLPVERVLQVGSPKGTARLLQRAGRSGHAPGRASRVTCVPAHAFELVEAAAARRAALAGRIEAREPPPMPLDVLVQHLVTVALGGGFDADDLLEEVRGTHAFAGLSRADWDWALAFASHGGGSLGAYPEYHKLVRGPDGRYGVPDAAIARRHRQSVGTIVADAAVEVRWLSGGRIGHVEESFAGMLSPGDCFWFAGRTLQLVRLREMRALVRRAPPGRAAVPRWNGGRMPLSSELAEAVLDLLEEARAGRLDEPEMRALEPLLALQARWSHLPARDTLLLEHTRTREGYHLFCFPFGGRQVHTGLAHLCAWRIARERPASFSLSVNDYGFELLSPEPVDWEAALAGGLFATAGLEEDIVASLNAGQLARSRFREIARVAGLVFQGFPGGGRSTRQLQASSELFFDVFERHDPGNRLLLQARREVLERELEFTRLRATLERVGARPPLLVAVRHPTPFAFPLLVARIREKLSTEQLEARVRRMVAALERSAGPAEAGFSPAPSPRARRAAPGRRPEEGR